MLYIFQNVLEISLDYLISRQRLVIHDCPYFFNLILDDDLRNSTTVKSEKLMSRLSLYAKILFSLLNSKFNKFIII